MVDFREWLFYVSNMTAQERLDALKPNEYPTHISIQETYKGEEMNAEFNLCSYHVGMYCAVYVNKQLAEQTGAANQQKFVKKIKKTLTEAIKRGAIVTFGTIATIKE